MLDAKAPEILYKVRMIGNLVNSLSVIGKVAGNKCEMVVDTGSNISIVRPDILRNSAPRAK